MEKLYQCCLKRCLPLLIFGGGCKTIPDARRISVNCADQRTKDSLIKYYVEDRAEKLPAMYNNPAWISYLDTVIKICPNIAQAYQLKAIPYLKSGDYAAAFPLEDKAVALDPGQFLSYRGFLKCIFTKDYSGAIRDFEAASLLTPGGFEMDHSYDFYLGLCYLEKNEWDRAADYLKRDIRSQSDRAGAASVHFNSLLYLGIVYFEMSANDSAQLYLKKSLAVYPELPEANYYLGMVYQNRGDKETASRFLKLAKKYIQSGFTMNEDNLFYVYYPHQILPDDVDSAEAAMGPK